MNNLENLTLREFRLINSMFNKITAQIGDLKPIETGLNCMIGQKVIIRTYSAGVHFGILDQKSGNEVILKNARSMWQWKTRQGISLSAVATHGIDKQKSKITEAVDYIWLEAIEIIPCTEISANTIESAQNAKAE